MATVRGKKGVTREFEGNFGPAVVLLMIMSGIIYYVIISTPAERMKIGVEEPKYEKIDLDVRPGLITAGQPAAVSNVEHSLEAVLIDGRPSPHSTMLRDLARLKSSAFSNQETKISFAIAKEPTVSAKVTAAVQGRQGNGKLTFTLNGREIFSEVVDIGKTAEVSLPLDAIMEGQNNLVISVSSPFLATEYTLSNLNLEALQYDDTKLFAGSSFKLSDTEFAGLQRAKLEAFVKSVAQPAGEVKISVNSKEAYSGKPAEAFDMAISLQSLKAGTNNIEFSTVRGAAYKITFGKITTAFSTSSGGQRSYDFEVSQFLADGARTKTYTCTLALARASGGDTVQAGINGATITGDLTDNTAALDICKYIKAGTNTLSLSASQEVTLDRAVVSFKQR
ncbi:MAG: hypothetical protein HY438_01875 [DPANN group archaeon]|nr:hypothetical protein [DPANN group archaeon]